VCATRAFSIGPSWRPAPPRASHRSGEVQLAKPLEIAAAIRGREIAADLGHPIGVMPPCRGIGSVPGEANAVRFRGGPPSLRLLGH
jgi:hypothetical protein